MMDKVWTININTPFVVAWKDGADSKPLKSWSKFPKITESSSSTPPGIQLGELVERSLSSIPLKPKDNTSLGFKHASSLTLAMLDLFAPPKANLPTQTP
jgi:hypothetical protein